LQTADHIPPDVWAVNAPLWKLAVRGSLRWARVLILCAHLVLIGGGYLAVLCIAEWRGVSVWNAMSNLDESIPALPWTFAVYATLYLYFPITVLLAPRGLRGVRALLYHLQAQLVVSVLSWVVFLTLPTRIHVRDQMPPALASSGRFLQEAYAQLYALDAPWNAWPSLHISLSLLMLLCSAHFTRMKVGRHELWKRGKLDTLAIAIAAPCWLALCVSVLTTKQHFVLDVWTGALVGWLTWCLYLRKLLDSLVLEA